MANFILSCAVPSPSETSEQSEEEAQVDISSSKLFCPCFPFLFSPERVYYTWLHLTPHSGKTEAQITGRLMH